jgi:hypothetical protein
MENLENDLPKNTEEKTVSTEQLEEAIEEIKEQPNQTNELQIDTDYLRTVRLHFAMPCYGGMLTESTFTGFIKWANIARQLGMDWTIETMVNESLISRARNTLTAKFLSLPDATHLMFIDADIGWEPWHLLALLMRKVDVIGGLYPMKTMPIQWVVNGVANGEQTEDGLIEVSKAGTGFLLIKREVFTKLNSHPAVKPYKNDIGLDPMYDQYLRTYFDTAVRQQRYYSEDWKFCEDWRDLGGKVYIDRRVLLRHTGTYTFCQENEVYLLDKYGNKFLQEQINTGKVKLVDEKGNQL